MWPRHIEASLGLWLALSVFIFAIPERETMVWSVDLGAALVIIVCSLLCHWHRTPRAHLVTLAIALALAAYGLAQPRPVPAWHQNHILVGLLLAMFTVLPTRTSIPPRAWRAQPPHRGTRP